MSLEVREDPDRRVLNPPPPPPYPPPPAGSAAPSWPVCGLADGGVSGGAWERAGGREERALGGGDERRGDKRVAYAEPCAPCY